MPQHSIKNRILARLSEKDFSALRPHLSLVTLRHKQDLMLPGEPIPRVYFPESGIISTVAGNDRSESIEVGQIGFEGMTDHVLQAGETARLHYFVQVPGSAWAIEAEHFANWIRERPSALRDLLRYMEYFVLQVSYTALSHGSYNIEERLARWLLMCFDREPTNDVPIVHEFIGRMLSVRRSGVTTALHVLEGHQAIKATRGHVVLRDREKLVELAGGSYGVPEQEYERVFGHSAR